MKTLLMVVVGILALVGIAAIVVLVWFRSKVLGTVRERLAQREADDRVVEVAAWFGTTGLDEEIERELPRYLRRELGETLSEDGALKASDLVYLGACDDKEGRGHYWYMPYGKEEVYAYVFEGGGTTSTGWGAGEVPPDPAMRERARALREARLPA